MTTRSRDREDSAGRLLRVLGDSELFHMKAAISSINCVKTGIRSDSILKPTGDLLERTTESRVLSLSDHKRIARLQAALTTVVNAYNAQNIAEEAGGQNLNRNLVHTVAGAAVLQSLRYCRASRTNCCLWGSQADKLHTLLGWMVDYECGRDAALSTRDYVRQLLLEWLQPTVDKQNQLAACLTVFELLQRRRFKLQTLELGSEGCCLFGDQAAAYMDAVRAVVERGTIQVVGSHRVKLSKLALVALETLALLCGDVAAQFLIATERSKRIVIDDGLIRKTVENMSFMLVTLRQRHFLSTRRQFLHYALQHLQSYVAACDSILSRPNGTGRSSIRDSNVNLLAMLDVLCWHWEATAPMLCTRSNASSRIQKQQVSEVLARVLKRWAFITFDTQKQFGSNGLTTNLEVIYAQLRNVCVLMDSVGGIKGCLKAFGKFSAETKTCFVFFFVRGLTIATKNGDDRTVFLILTVLRSVLLPSDRLNLLSSRDEEQDLLSQLLRVHSNVSVARGVSGSGSYAQTELELFVSDFIISRALFVTELVRQIQDSNTLNVMSTISLVRTFLYQLDSATTQTPLYRHWRNQLTPDVLNLITHENHSVRRLAISCLPSLDAVCCIARLTAAGVLEAENYTISSALGYLFAASTGNSLEMIVSWFIDACRFGSVQVHFISNKVPASPRDWSDYSIQLSGNVKENIAANDERKELQEKLFSLCFGPSGWSKHIQLANARSKILRVILRKIFGSPRDPVLLRMLREFVACGWMDHEVFAIMGKQICSHMINVPRLTEELLDDNAPSAAKTIEGLLFSRLAPLLVLRMLPRKVFGANRRKILSCGREDLDHLNKYLDRQLQFDYYDPKAMEMDTTSEVFFHILARSVVDPLEFKDVKMLATECLSKFPPRLVLPFVFASLVAFLQEMTSHGEQGSSFIEEDSVPTSCGLVTAKLMVYYLNRVFSEDEHAYKDCDITSRTLVLLVQILGIPPSQDADESLLTDLQRGCIDCIALVFSRLVANENGQERKKTQPTSAVSLMNLLLSWIFGVKNGEDMRTRDADDIHSRVQELLESMWPEARYDQLPPQVRICCCNVLLSAISRSENSVLASWKTLGFLSRIVLATGSCLAEDVVAGGLQIIFSFLYKASDVLSMEENGDLQLVYICFEATATRLESTHSESVAMNGLKVIGALIGKLPGFIGTLSPEQLQRLIKRCLILLRDRRVSHAVSELAQSLLQAMTPP